MTAKLQAIYENGMLKLQHPLPLPDQAAVTVTVESEGPSASDADRAAWLELSKRHLSQVWDNPADDVFNELLQETQL